MANEVDATGLNPAEVLAELYNNAKSNYIYQYDATSMTAEDAEKYLLRSKYFDYLKGRCMKLNFDKYPIINVSSYDAHYGTGYAQQCLDRVKNATLTTTIPRGPFDLTLGKTVASLSLNKFDKVWFVNSFVKELESAGIPYPTDWHMFMGIENNQANFSGSMGGSYAISVNAPVVKTINGF
jgi:hypothetical protein